MDCPGFSTFDWLKLSYLDNDGWGNGNSEISDSTQVLNSVVNKSSVSSKNFDASLKSENAFRVFAVDMVRIELDAKYNRLKRKSFTMSDINYMQDGGRDYRDNYLDAPHQDFNISTGASYDLLMRGFHVRPGYTYSYTYNKTHNLLYRLDKLSGRDSSLFDRLPSAREALRDVLDDANSYYFREYRNEHTLNVYYNRQSVPLLNAELQVNLPLHYTSANLHYYRLGRHDVSRHATFFEPDIRLTHWGNAMSWSLNAAMKSSLPDLTEMVDYRDDSDPLNIRLGNPDLKDIHRYSADGNVSFKGNTSVSCASPPDGIRPTTPWPTALPSTGRPASPPCSRRA